MRRLLRVADIKLDVIGALKRQEILLGRRGAFCFWGSNCRWHNDLLALLRRARLSNIRSTADHRKDGSGRCDYSATPPFSVSDSTILSKRGSLRSGSRIGFT